MFQLNVIASRGIGGAFRGCLGDVLDVLGGVKECVGCIVCK